MDPSSTLKLNNGVEIPRLGLGVFRAGRGRPTRDAVTWALEAGYRHIDTARIYGNEGDVGAAVRASSIPRHQVFITTKLWNADQGYDSTLRAFDRSLEVLGLDVIDLYFMHWPVPQRRLDSWRAMEAIVESGRCRAIGVSDFTETHLDELLDHAGVVPAVNQIELHPYLQQPSLVARCRELGLAVEAYCPLVRARRFDHPRLVAVAREAGRTLAQVLIRWSLQKGFIVIPKSTNRDRIIENAGVFDFELGPEHLTTLDGLDEGLRIAWDPTDLD